MSVPRTECLCVDEVVAYEALWRKYRSAHAMRALFAKEPTALPSKVAKAEMLGKVALDGVRRNLESIAGFERSSFLLPSDSAYPLKLAEIKSAPESLFYQGDLGLLRTPCVAVTGSRNASEEGKRMARQVSRVLVQCGCTVVSGLASGVDTSAHRGALEAGGRTVAIIGTALSVAFPRSNQRLQDLIGREHLLMSHVPFSESAEKESVSFHFLFRERLQTIAALSLATVVVEATGAGASMLQAREALRLGRQVIVMSPSIKEMLVSGCDSREYENVIVSDLPSLELNIDSALRSAGA